MKFTITKSDNGDDGFELLSPAVYTFTILQVITTNDEGEPLVARTGTPYVKLKCCEKESGLRLTHCLFLDPERSLKVFHFLNAIGEEPKVGEEIELDFERWMHRMFRGKVDVKDGRNNIIAVYGFSQTAPEPPLPSDLETPIQGDVPSTTIDPDLDEDVPF